MSHARILGIDPGTRKSGIAVIEALGTTSDPAPLPQFWRIAHLDTLRGSLWKQAHDALDAAGEFAPDFAAVQVPFMAGEKCQVGTRAWRA